MEKTEVLIQVQGKEVSTALLDQNAEQHHVLPTMVMDRLINNLPSLSLEQTKHFLVEKIRSSESHDELTSALEDHLQWSYFINKYTSDKSDRNEMGDLYGNMSSSIG